MSVNVSPEKIREWSEICAIYNNKIERMLKVGELCDKNIGCDPYFYQWKFTPIEQKAWDLIRIYGGTFYPQVPVKNYFIDFGNPYLKIGLEVDGKQWHDIKKDKKRDYELSKLGWRIYRAKGREVMWLKDNPYQERIDDEKYKYYLENSGEGLIKAIAYIYFDYRYDIDDRYFWKRILESHMIENMEDY